MAKKLTRAMHAALVQLQPVGSHIMTFTYNSPRIIGGNPNYGSDIKTVTVDAMERRGLILRKGRTYAITANGRKSLLEH